MTPTNRDSRDFPNASGHHGAQGCGCTFNIAITASGDVHVHNRCADGHPSDLEPAPEEPAVPPAGTCLPVIAGAKHKLSRTQKLDMRLENDRIPSALATSTLQAMRRFTKGKAAANQLEEMAFATFRTMPASLFKCIVTGAEDLPGATRDGLFISAWLAHDEPIDVAVVREAVFKEIQQRAGLAFLGDANAASTGRPGLNRMHVTSGEDFTTQVRICRVRNLRTAHHKPRLTPGDYVYDEIQHDCAPVTTNGITETVCQVRTSDCPGHGLDGFCIRVIDVGQGEGVELDGVNFLNVDAKVRLVDKETATIAREVDAFVWGDITTPLNETVNGVTQLIDDCRVRDKLTFRVPDDIPAGVYGIQVAIPNNTGNPAFGQSVTSQTEYINVLPPPGAQFQVAIDRLGARVETSPAMFGSDEIALQTVAMAVTLDLSPGEAQHTVFETLSCDTGSVHAFNPVGRPIFRNEANLSALTIAVLGYEIDSEGAYAQLSGWHERFVALFKEQLAYVLGNSALASAAAEGIRRLTDLGWYGWLAVACALSTVIVIDLIAALWAPADKIIEDVIFLSVVDLERLTNANAPIPQPSTHNVGKQITVNVNKTIVPEKTALQYRETREYVCNDQDSRYELTYRYNRVGA